MEYQRIGQDGRRHSPRLFSVLLTEFLANLFYRSGVSYRHIRQEGCGLTYPINELIGRFFNNRRRHGG